MNGVDLLIVVGGLLFVLFLFICWERYSDWAKWDRQRRRRRRLDRIEFQDYIDEAYYRAYLRVLLVPSLVNSIRKVTRSFQKINQAMGQIEPYEPAGRKR